MRALVHGYDVARAANKPWAMPRKRDLYRVLLGLLPVLPYFVDTSEAVGLRASTNLNDDTSQRPARLTKL